MKKVYYLKTCSTCSRILKELDLPANFELQDIKINPITVEQLDALKTLAGSYEALFSRRAQLYKQKGLKDQVLSEDDYKNYILEHYTFLSRPVTVIDNAIYIGNSKKTTESIKQALNEN